MPPRFSNASVRVAVPDTGPLATLAKLGALDALLVFKAIVVTDYAAFEATRRRAEMAGAKAIHNFLREHAGRIDFEKTGYGQNYLQLWRLHERFAADPELAAQLGVDMTPPQAGENTVIEYVRDIVGKAPANSTLILVEEDQLLRDLSPLPRNAHMRSTRAFLNALPHGNEWHLS